MSAIALWPAKQSGLRATLHESYNVRIIVIKEMGSVWK